MPYAVKEIFYTLQGEGAHTGRAAVFCRFAGCNLWSGREEDRATRVASSATRILSAPTATAAASSPRRELAARYRGQWPGGAPERRDSSCCTGGEPLLQLDAPLDRRAAPGELHHCLETNGTIDRLTESTGSA